MMQCNYPILVKDPQFGINTLAKQHMYVPCGKCYACKSNRSRMWIFRLKEELKASSSAYFITLTYDDNNLVYCNSGIPTLHKADLQKYIKRLRKSNSKYSQEQLRYFAVGEYGSKTYRPHYHALLFNVHNEKLIDAAWSINDEPIGIVHIGNVTQDSIAYCTKYVMKSLYNEIDPDLKEDESFIPEFTLMSKGIGKQYVEKKSVQRMHKYDLKNYVVDEKGFKYNLPRYYRDRLFTEEEKEQISNNAKHEIKKLDSKEWEKELKDSKYYQKEMERKRYNDYVAKKRLKQKNDKL